MAKSRIDRVIDQLINIRSLYRRYNVPFSETSNFVCPHHPDRQPSSRLYGNHLFCFAERRSYYSSDILKLYSSNDYDTACRIIAAKYPAVEPHLTPQRVYDFSPLHFFRNSDQSFDSVLNFIRNSDQHLKEDSSGH